MEAFQLTSRRFTTLLFLVAPFISPVFSQYRASQADLDAWFRTTTATVRFTGADFSAPLGPQDARIIYCTEYDHDSKICGSGGECFAYQGRVDRCMKPEKMFQCVAAFNTNVCMGYSEDCTLARECIFTSTCEDRLANGFCLGIDSISLGFPDPINNPRQPLPSPSTPPPTSQSSSHAQDPSSSSTPSSAASESSSTSSSSDSESSDLPTTRRSASFETFLASSGSASGPSSSSTGSTTPGSSTSGEERSGSSLPIGAMVGIALGGLLVGIVSILLILCIRRRRKRAASRTPPSNLPVLLTPVTPSAPWQPIQDSPPIAQYHFKSYLDSPNPDSPAGFPSSDSATTTTSALESYRDHADSGVRLNPPAHQQTSRTMVELPPPYSQG